MAGIVNQKAIAVSEARGDVEETLEKMYHSEWEGELLIALAAWEMGEKLVDGDIELYTIIVYDTTDTRGAGMCAYYDIYYMGLYECMANDYNIRYDKKICDISCAGTAV